MNPSVVEQLPADPGLDRVLDRLRHMGFRPVGVPWLGGVDAGLARHNGTVYDLLRLPRHDVATVTRAEIVYDRNDPGRLLDSAETLFSGSPLEAAEFLLRLVADPPTVTGQPTVEREAGR